MKKDKTIFFDLYQTLIDVELDPDKKKVNADMGWDALARGLFKYRVNISGKEIFDLYEKQRVDFYLKHNENIYHHNMLEMLKAVIQEQFKISLAKKDLVDLIYEYRKISRGYIKLYPGIIEVLNFLFKDYELGVASHTQDCFTEVELKELDIEKFFNYLIFTSKIGLRKTSVEFYKKLLEIAGKKAEDCIMVGDNYEADYINSRSAGLKAIWIKNPATSSRFVIEKEPINKIDLEEIGRLVEMIDDETA